MPDWAKGRRFSPMARSLSLFLRKPDRLMLLLLGAVVFAAQATEPQTPPATLAQVAAVLQAGTATLWLGLALLLPSA